MIPHTRILRVNGRLRGPVYGFTRTVAVPLEVEPISPTVRGRNRFYGPSFRNFTGRLYALSENDVSDVMSTYSESLTAFVSLFNIPTAPRQLLQCEIIHILFICMCYRPPKQKFPVWLYAMQKSRTRLVRLLCKLSIVLHGRISGVHFELANLL